MQKEVGPIAENAIFSSAFKVPSNLGKCRILLERFERRSRKTFRWTGEHVRQVQNNGPTKTGPAYVDLRSERLTIAPPTHLPRTDRCVEDPGVEKKRKRP